MLSTMAAMEASMVGDLSAGENAADDSGFGGMTEDEFNESTNW